MTKQEFCERAKIEEKDLSSEDYAVIEKVYATHPVIDPVKGKDQIAAIFNLTGGMRIIRDMVPTAEEAASIEDEIRSIGRQISELNAKMVEKKYQYEALKK
ncbi:MAG: hypothetical protein RSC06_00665 [Clostridia bacterium]